MSNRKKRVTLRFKDGATFRKGLGACDRKGG